MAGRLDGKVALITGSARGMGAAEAVLFAAEGAKVVVSDVLEAEGEALAKEIGDSAIFVRLDVTQPGEWHEAVDAAVSEFGRLNVLVNNAGIVRFSMLANTTLEEYRLVTEVNQTGVFLGLTTVYPAMCAAGGGSIVNISSVDGLHGSPTLGSYVASKFAVRGLTKVAALEWAQRNIRVNSIHPGGISTPMADTMPGVSRADLEALVGQAVPML
ncbi:MAG: SDR family NAD(P)-dependent oxidoreductase, partial [Actinobacteria bacterium]|nr:SDR family NAD(P)-dependent oxidoreductase [Actinomycetota bacterium]